MSKKSIADVHQAVTDNIIAAIEASPGKFALPWQQSGAALTLPTNAITGAPYQGMNILILLCASAQHGYSGRFASYRQLLADGQQVRAGERGIPIVFYKEYTPQSFRPDPANPDDDGRRRVLKHSYVFALEQTLGHQPAPPADSAAADYHPDIDRLIQALGVKLRIGGDRAYYRLSDDLIGLPDPSLYHQQDLTERRFHMGSTALHEAGHATGHPSRLARDFGGKYGTEKYCLEEVVVCLFVSPFDDLEEIVAELTASFMAAHLGISSTPRIDHAQYIAHFVQLMKADNRIIFTAAAKASEATRYLLSLLGNEVAHAA